MNIANLGHRTDCIIRKYGGIIKERPEYFVIRMPSNPTFYSGNILLFKSSPRLGDYQKWIDAHVNEFGPAAGHVGFGWDTEERGETEAFSKNGFSINVESVLQLVKLKATKIPGVDVEVRRIVSDADWHAVTELQILVSEDEVPTGNFRDFKVGLFKTYREISENGHGDWWGAFSGSTLISDMGLYFDESFQVGRFQAVETHPDYRRKGVCSSLLHNVIKHAIDSVEARDLVICTENNSDAIRVYKALGFEHRVFQYGMSLHCPYENRFEQVRPLPRFRTDTSTKPVY